MSRPCDQAVIDQLGDLIGELLLEESAVLTRSTGFCVANNRVASAVLDRLVQLGWKPPPSTSNQINVTIYDAPPRPAIVPVPVALCPRCGYTPR